MRKVYVTITTRIIIRANDDVDIEEVLHEMDYSFVSQTEGADIEDEEIIDHTITDSV